jgi:hypothetical protein
MHSQVTIVVAVDLKTIEQWEVALPTWVFHHPEIATECKWLIMYDRKAIDVVLPRALKLADAYIPTAKVTVKGWTPHGTPIDTPYESQREKMLTSFVHGPANWVQTPFWMKIDTDAICLQRTPLFELDWFAPQPCGRPLAWVANPWGYSKPAEQPAQLDAWARWTKYVWPGPALNLPPPEPGAKRIGHSRMASWMSLYSIEFTKFAAELAAETVGDLRIPVPSQDGYHSYVAQRAQWPYKTASFKRRGWTNCPKLPSLIETAALALRTTISERMQDA